MKMEKWDMLKIFQEWGERGIKKSDGVGEFNYDIYKNFCKCHNVIQDNNNKKNACLV
jgi:hypothetical protein